MKPFARPAPEPMAEVAEPAPEPAPVGGVLSALASFSPSAETANYAASMGRKTSVMVSHVRDRLDEAAHMLGQLAFDATMADDVDGAVFINAMIERIS
jgi:hypothetical protein